MPEPKRHHYVPESYSKAFAGRDGFIWLYDKWERRALSLTPKNALTVGHLYRQPIHAEKRFNSSLENYFANSADSDWPSLRDAVARSDMLTQEQWGKLVEFVCAQLVRVPLSMNAVIEILREQVFSASGKIGPLPDIFLKRSQDITGKPASTLRDLTDSGVITLKIDPHRSISSMPLLVRNVPLFQQGFSFGVPKFLHNETELDFISSDNPVVFHSGRHGEIESMPYEVNSDRNFAFYFPISPRLMMVNSAFNSKRRMHCPVKNRDQVSILNCIISRFSYRFILANSQTLAEKYGSRFSDICPRPNFSSSIVLNGNVERIGYKFGYPTKIENRWDYDF